MQPPAIIEQRQQVLGEALLALERTTAARLSADDATARLPVSPTARPLSPERALLSLCRQSGARLDVRYVFVRDDGEPKRRERRRPAFVARRVTLEQKTPLSLAAIGSRLGLVFDAPKELPEVVLIARDRPLSSVLDALAAKTKTRWEVQVRLENGSPGGAALDDAARYDRLQRDVQSLLALSDDEQAEELDDELARTLAQPPAWRVHTVLQIARRLDEILALWKGIPDEHRERQTPRYLRLAAAYGDALGRTDEADREVLNPLHEALERLHQSLSARNTADRSGN